MMKKTALPGTIIKISLLTASVIIFFEALNLSVIYDYVKLDYYMAFIAGFFLFIGFFLAKGKAAQQAPPKTNLFSSLTNKELDIVKLIAEGKSNKEIAAMHFIELSTVKTHINNIYSKLSVSNRKEAREKYFESAR